LAVVIVLTSFKFAFGRETIRIGSLLDLSGNTSEVGKAAQRVSEMAVDVVNAEGGVVGRMLELVTFDTRGDPILGKGRARELVFGRKVSAVLGPTDWPTAMMIKPFFEEAQIPAMMLTWEDSVIRGGKFGIYDWIFRLPLRRITALERICAFARERGWTRVGLVTTSDTTGREVRQWLERRGKSYGIHEVLVESFIRAEDITEKLVRLVSQAPQVIVSWCPLPHAASVARILEKVGTEIPLFQCHEISPQRYVEMAGLAAKESLVVSNKMLVWRGLEDDDSQKEMIRDFVHRYRDVYRYENSHPICPFLGYVWDSVMILARSMREVGTDGAQVRDAVERIHRHVGIGGIYGFNHENHNGLDRDSTVIIRVDGICGDGRRWIGSWGLAE